MDKSNHGFDSSLRCILNLLSFIIACSGIDIAHSIYFHFAAYDGLHNMQSVILTHSAKSLSFTSTGRVNKESSLGKMFVLIFSTLDFRLVKGTKLHLPISNFILDTKGLKLIDLDQS